MIFDLGQLTIGAHLNEVGLGVSKDLSVLLQFCNTLERTPFGGGCHRLALFLSGGL